MPARTQTRRTRRAPASRARPNSIRSVVHALRGHEVKVLPQPPEFTSRPWFGLTVRIDAPGTLVTSSGILASLRTQLGWASDVPLSYRLHMIRVWGPVVSFDSNNPLQPLNVAFIDPIQEAASASGAPAIVNRVLEQYTRYPDQLNRACVGYCYSLAHQSVTYASSATAAVDVLRLNGTGPNSVVYVNLLFRTGTIDPAALPPTVAQPAEIAGSQPPNSWFSR